MAGELTHIIPTHPSDPNYRASKTRGIIWCDANGVAHTVTAVYWSPTNNVNDRKLIWELNNYVPYDSACSVTVTLSQNKKAWIVTITKNGEDVTSSLSQMITWIYNGKGERVLPHYAYSNTIDLSEFPRGNYRLDLSQITSKAGGYFPGSGAISFPDHIYIDTLLAGNQTVVFEYTPSADVSLTSLGIFTNSTNTNTTCNVAIYHESGLVVYKHNTDTIDGTQTFYDLQGKKRHINGISGVTLKGGLKYYIQYTQETDSNHTTFYPAYFNDASGKYKVWYHGSVQNKQTVNMANFNKYWGLLDDSSRIFGMDAGDFFIWNGSSNVGMTVGNCYVRSNVGTGQGYVFRGVIGNPATYDNVTSSDIEQLLAWPAKTEFIWYRNNYTSGNVTIKREYVYAKSQDTSSIDSVELNEYSDWTTAYTNMTLLLNDLKTHTETLITKGTIYNNLMAGSICSLKNGYVVDSTFDPNTTVTTLPSNPTVGHIYAVYEQYSHYVQSVVYTSNGWKKVGENTSGDDIGYADFMNASSFASLLTEVGKNSDFASETYDSYRIAASLRDDATYPIQTGRKYFLEINGQEVV